MQLKFLHLGMSPVLINQQRS